MHLIQRRGGATRRVCSTLRPSLPDAFDWHAMFDEKRSWAGDAALIRNLRSNHAGETGAVFIYKGAIAAMGVMPSRYLPDTHRFAATHLQAEVEHLAYFERLLDQKMKSILVPLWRISGFCLGFFPTLLFGEKALFVTVEAVETFVEVHYEEQIHPLEKIGAYPHLVSLLRHCCEEEVNHKKDALARWLKEGEKNITPMYDELAARDRRYVESADLFLLEYGQRFQAINGNFTLMGACSVVGPQSGLLAGRRNLRRGQQKVPSYSS